MLNYTELSENTVLSKIAEKGLSSLIVKLRDRIIPVKYSNIAYFSIANKIIQVRLFDESTYFINRTLEEIQELCDGNFYRVNRQVLVNKEAIGEVLQSGSRKLIPFSQIEECPQSCDQQNEDKRIPDLAWEMNRL